MITHRLVGLDQMDQIIVLADGRIVARGTHADLVAATGLYRQMWQQQTAVSALQQETQPTLTDALAENYI